MGDITDRLKFLFPQYFGDYQNTSNAVKILSTFEPEIQLLIDTFEKIRLWRNIDDAEGTTLDLAGTNVNLLRGSSDDVQFRKNIKTEIIANKSQGDLDTVKEVAELVLNKNVSLFEAWNQSAYGNASSTLILEVETDDNSFNVPEKTIKKAVSGGVALITQGKDAVEQIDIIEEVPTVFQVVSLKCGTFDIAKTMGSLF